MNKNTKRPCWFWAGWEPDRYYRRIGPRSTPFFGGGQWVKPWREALEGMPCLEALREAGAGVLMTRFYKGFGPAVERESWPSLAAYVERAHRCGIAVWGYLQGCSLFGETLFNEYPEARDWVARDEQGKVRCWGGAYNRFAPCLTSEGYLAMMERVIEAGVREVGLDGFHMDNNYSQHCYCTRCREGFRRWLGERGDLEERTGLPEATNVEPPPLHAQVSLAADPLALLWIEFGVETRYRFMKRLRERIKALKPEAFFSGNPAFMRSYASRLTHSLDPSREGELFDTVCIENGNRPRWSAGGLYTQADKHLVAEAGGFVTWVTSWAAGEEGGGYDVPRDAGTIWAGLAEEYSFSNVWAGNTWALRAAGDGGRMMYEELGTEWGAFRQARGWFEQLQEELGTSPRRQWGEVAVYFDPRALSASPAGDALLLQAWMGALFERRVAFRLIYPGMEPPRGVRTVLVCGQGVVAQGEIERLSRWRACAAPGEGSREVWLLGNVALYDQWLVTRERGTREALLNLPGVRHWPLKHFPKTPWRPASSSIAYFRGYAPGFSEQARELAEPVFKALAEERLTFGVEAPDGVLANVEERGDGVLVLHLRDLREGDQRRMLEGVRLYGAVHAGTGYSPAWDGPLELESTLPAFEHYACILLTKKP